MGVIRGWIAVRFIWDSYVIHMRLRREWLSEENHVTLWWKSEREFAHNYCGHLPSGQSKWYFSISFTYPFLTGLRNKKTCSLIFIINHEKSFYVEFVPKYAFSRENDCHNYAPRDICFRVHFIQISLFVNIIEKKYIQFLFNMNTPQPEINSPKVLLFQFLVCV